MLKFLEKAFLRFFNLKNGFFDLKRLKNFKNQLGERNYF